jgi:glycosyltransferase involved in cell wall biosynthesis
VLISSACYPRKNPGLINNVINACPDLKFTIIGKDWPEYITSRANVDYKNNLEYEKYQDEYEKCDVFLSCATLEGGGPGGLIEAMLSNIVPVVSDTGNARQYIVDGYNGFIFPTDANSDVVAEMIRKAYEANPQDSLPYNDIWQTAQHYTWDFYALQMKEIIDGTTDHSNSATLSN